MRRLLHEMASGNEVRGDTTTLEDLSALERTTPKAVDSQNCFDSPVPFHR